MKKDKTIEVPLFHYETKEMLMKVPEYPAIEGMQERQIPFTGAVLYHVI